MLTSPSTHPLIFQALSYQHIMPLSELLELQASQHRSRTLTCIKSTYRQDQAILTFSLRRLIEALPDVKGRMKRLEGVRLEVDSRQRTVSSLTTTLNKQRATLPPNNTQMRTKGEVSVDSTIRKLTNKDNKLAGLSFTWSPDKTCQTEMKSCTLEVPCIISAC